MPRAKENTPEDLQLSFTGKMSILIEVEEYGPLQFRIDDFELTKEIVRIILDRTDNITSVDSYDKREQKTLTKLLDF